MSPSDVSVRRFLHLFCTLIKLCHANLLVIKPPLWSRIEFLSPGGHEYQRSSWLSATTFYDHVHGPVFTRQQSSASLSLQGSSGRQQLCTRLCTLRAEGLCPQIHLLKPNLGGWCPEVGLREVMGSGGWSPHGEVVVLCKDSESPCCWPPNSSLRPRL